jgi:hypothetical protein
MLAGNAIMFRTMQLLSSMMVAAISRISSLHQARLSRLAG